MHLLDRFRARPPAAEPASAARLIVGLGNPGREYAGNRHNIGFMAAEAYAARHGLTFNKLQGKAVLALGRAGDHRLIIAKPQTYMNESGRAVSALMNFYKLSIDQLIVIFDDLDLPFGAIRLRPDGGAGGHNGLRSIIAQLGGNRFARLRLGIGRPPGRMDPAAFVLQDFGRDEAQELPHLLDRAADALDTFVNSGITVAMNKHNVTPTGEKDKT